MQDPLAQVMVEVAHKHSVAVNLASTGPTAMNILIPRGVRMAIRAEVYEEVMGIIESVQKREGLG